MKDPINCAIVGNVVKNIAIIVGVSCMAKHFDNPKLLSWLLLMPFTQMSVTTHTNHMEDANNEN